MKKPILLAIGTLIVLFLLIFSITLIRMEPKSPATQASPVAPGANAADLFSPSSVTSMLPSEQRSGVIYRQANGGYLISAFLPTLPGGSFYQGWLVGTDNRVLLLGKLYLESKEQNRWTLVAKSNDVQQGYSKVWITREQKDDSQPEKIVLQGAF